MIRNAVTSSVALINQTISSGVKITPRTGTPLSDLVQVSTPHEAFGFKLHGEGLSPEDFSLEGVEQALSRSREISGMQLSVGTGAIHGEIVADAAELASAVIDRNLTLARTVVNPKIMEVLEYVHRQANLSVSDVVDVQIEPLNFDGLWKSEILRTLVDGFKKSGFTSATSVPYHPLYTDISIETLLDSGSARLDDRVREWLADGGLNAIEAAWNKYFVLGSSVDLTIGIDTNATQEALATFIIANALKNKRPFDVNVSDDLYTRQLETILYFTAPYIAAAVENFELDAARDVLVISYPVARMMKDAKIRVNGAVYKKWLDNGGVPEIILGAYLVDQATDSASLIRDGERYIKAWDAQLAKLKVTQDSNRLATIKEALLISARDVIESIVDNGGVVTNEMYTVLRQRVDAMTLYHIGELHAYIRTLICDVLYPNTEVKRILQLLDTYGKEYPELPPRELALLAVTDMVSKWVVAMFTVERAK